MHCLLVANKFTDTIKGTISKIIWIIASNQLVMRKSKSVLEVLGIRYI